MNWLFRIFCLGILLLECVGYVAQSSPSHVNPKIFASPLFLISARAQLRDITSESTKITVVGMVVPGGVECLLVQGEDGKRYTLDPLYAKTFHLGERVRFIGTEASRSFCMQGKTINVQTIAKID